jgi:hypothetical protein
MKIVKYDFWYSLDSYQHRFEYLCELQGVGAASIKLKMLKNQVEF